MHTGWGDLSPFLKVVTKELYVHPKSCVQKQEALLKRVAPWGQWKVEEKQVHPALGWNLGLLPPACVLCGPGPAPVHPG